MSYTILTDSCSDLTEEMVDLLKVRVIPMEFEIDGRRYLDYSDHHDLSTADFFKMMREHKIAKTAQITPETYLGYFKEEYDKKQDVLVLAFSSALSGTCNAAYVARNQFLEEHEDAHIEVFDTLSACGGEGLMVSLSATARNDRGLSMEENISYLEEIRPLLAHRFTVDDLGALKRGGRLSATSAFLGTLIGIKPVLHADDNGRLVPTDKVRGRTQSIKKLFQYVKETIVNPEDQTIFISNADDPASAKMLEDLILAEIKVKKIVHLPFGPIIGAHTGPGALAVFFLGSTR